MGDLFWLTDEQMERLRPFVPQSHGRPHADDRRVLSGIVFVNRMECAGEMRPAPMVLPRRSTNGGSVGASVAYARARWRGC